jgi:hypothetical protein
MFLVILMVKRSVLLYDRIEEHSGNRLGRGKAVSVTYFECLGVCLRGLVIHHAMLICHVVLSSMSCPALQHF